MPPFISRDDERRIAAYERSPASMASPEALAAWERSLKEFENAGGVPAYSSSRKRLNDQTRTEAFDPWADRLDPGNVNVVDYAGRMNPVQGPMQPGVNGPIDPSSPFQPPPAKPASKLGSANKIAQKVASTLRPQFSAEYDVPADLPRLFQPWTGEGDTVHQPTYQFGEQEQRRPTIQDFLMANPLPSLSPPRVPIDLRQRPPAPVLSGVPGPSWNPFQPAPSDWLLNKQESYRPEIDRWRQAFPKRAHGGYLPGYMRGGYPEVYGLEVPQGVPERTFDSGGMNYVDGFAEGSTGRADDVNARLSEKEYVMTAEDMSMLGDGNPDAGAKAMDKMRANLRKHKGKALAKGKFSPNAKSPEAYLASNPVSDGLKRLSLKGPKK